MKKIKLLNNKKSISIKYFKIIKNVQKIFKTSKNN